MATPSELPTEVVQALHANRKVEAIKRLRELQGLGLKEAADVVDSYIAAHPGRVTRRTPPRDYGAGRAILIIVVSAVVYGAYQLFTG